jgi:hypothetical protein
MKKIQKTTAKGKAAERTIRKRLLKLMREDDISPECLQMYTAVKGHFPEPGKLPAELSPEYIEELTKPEIWREACALISGLTYKPRIMIRLSDQNTKKLMELAALIETDKADFINMLVQEELDNYLDPISGMLQDTIDGWKYKTPAEAQRVADAVNKWCSGAPGAGRITCKGRELVHSDYRKEKNDSRKVA